MEGSEFAKPLVITTPEHLAGGCRESQRDFVKLEKLRAAPHIPPHPPLPPLSAPTKRTKAFFHHSTRQGGTFPRSAVYCPFMGQMLLHLRKESRHFGIKMNKVKQPMPQ